MSVRKGGRREGGEGEIRGRIKVGGDNGLSNIW
jgi:hypothetical protein